MAQLPQTALTPAPATPSDAHGRSPRWVAPALAALLAAVLLVNVAYLAVHGAVAGGDTGRYVEGGRGLFHGDGLTARAALYLGYDFIVGVVDLAGLGFSGVAVVQIGFTVAGTAAVFALGRRLGGVWA